MRSCILPAEIWSKIVVSLSKRDIAQASRVSKSWNKALAYLLGNRIFITIDENQYKQLKKDLKKYPNFAHKVTRLKVTAGDTDTGPLLLRNIINHCPNLLFLKFTNLKIYGYLNMLNSRDTRLSNILEIKVVRLSACPPSIKRFNVWVNFRFSTTVTSLYLSGISNNGAVKSYGGFIKYTHCFPHLTVLSICGDRADSTLLHINLNHLLETNTSLSTLIIEGTAHVFGDIRKLSPGINAAYPSLKTLKLSTFKTDITLVSYIQSRFRSLETLQFDNVTVYPNKLVSDETSEQAIQELYTLTIRNLHFLLRFKGRHYTYNS